MLVVIINSHEGNTILPFIVVLTIIIIESLYNMSTSSVLLEDDFNQ